MAASGGGTATAAANQQQQQKPGGTQQAVQNKRPSRWTGSHPFGSNSANSNSTAGQQNARAQSPLNPSANRASPGPAGPAPGNQTAANHAGGAAAAPFANISATPDELAKMHERMLFLLANLVGHKVRCTVRTGIVYSAIFSSINDTDQSVCLKLARQVEPPIQANGNASGSSASSQPQPKPTLVIPAKDVIDIYAENVSLDAATVSSVPGASRPSSPNVAAANQAAMNNIMAALGGDTFRTDTDISGTGTSREQRELQRWGSGDASLGGLEDGLEGPSTAGGKSRGGAWDQFAVNERLFGATTNYQEEIYTTKLDKSGADYKAREARAARIAAEIESGVAINAHVAEERGGVMPATDDSGLDEEDKYSGVIRGQGAYVPPGARRALAIQKPPAAQTPGKDDVAKANGAPAPVSSAAAAAESKNAQTTPATPAIQQPASTNVTPANKEDLVGDFKKFVTNEKEKLVQKRSQLEKQNKDKKMAELKSWSAAFVLKTPVPADLVPILAKDEVKQKELANRKPIPSVAPSAAASANSLKPASTHTSPNPQAAALKGGVFVSTTQLSAHAGASGQQNVGEQKKASAWALPSIPPFDPQRAAAARAAKAAAAAGGTSSSTDAKPAPAGSSTTKFNVAAKEFVFRPTAGTFVPGAAAASAQTPAVAPAAAPLPNAAPAPAASLVRKPSEIATPIAPSPAPAQPLNPFFGTRIIRNNNNAPFRVKEDFSPFKRNEKIPDPATVQPAWGFTGKTYKAAASYPFASTSGASHAVSPQPSHALPPHMQQGTNGRMHGVASPPLSSQTSHLSRTSSSQGPATLASSMATSGPSSEDGLGKSGISTPVPSSNTSASGVPTPGSAQMLPIQHHQPPGGGPQVTALHGMPGRPHMVPQGYVLHPQAGQQYPGFPYVPGTHQQGPGHIQSPGGQHPHMIHQQVQSQQMQGHQIPGQPAAQFVMGPNGPIFGQFFPPGAVPAMLSPQMMGQMAHGQTFMQPMHVPQQAGVRGQNSQMVAGQPHQVFYPVQGSPAMHHHYVQMSQQQGMSMPPSQQMFEQPGQ